MELSNAEYAIRISYWYRKAITLRK